MANDLPALRALLVRRHDQLHIVLEQTTSEMASTPDPKRRSELRFEAVEILAQRHMLATVLLDIDRMLVASVATLAEAA